MADSRLAKLKEAAKKKKEAAADHPVEIPRKARKSAPKAAKAPKARKTARPASRKR